jgi:hypothetical protein
MRHLLANGPFRLYLFGLVCIFGGAWGMAATGSLIPMALSSSVGLMLGVPLVRQLLSRAMRPARVPPRR